jgi:DNA primase
MQNTEAIKSKIDIVDIIQEYIPLKASGGSYKTVCPFHNENTPSFMVSQSKQIWHCFGCNSGGDIFSFVMRYEGIEFVDALQLLAKKAGVSLERQDTSLKNEKSRLFEICERATQYYEQCLKKASFTEKARKYLTDRKVSSQSIEVFRIGFSPPNSARGFDINNFLLKKGFTESDIVKTGLVVKSERGFGYFDRFRNRVIFPICDVHSRVVGFTSRILPGDDDGMGKYVNTPNTMLYNKGETLYGLHLAKGSIRKKDRVVIVEGNMDVIASHEISVSNVVASSGTALTMAQIQLIKRFTDNVTFSFDMDSAGFQAAERAFESVIMEGIHVKMLTLPKESGAKDADEFIRHFGDIASAKVAWEQCIEKSEPFMKIMFNKALENIRLDDADEKRITAHKILTFLAKIPDKIEQAHFISELSERIHVHEEMLYETLKTKQRNEKIAKRAHIHTVVNNPLDQKISSRERRLMVSVIGFLLLDQSLIPTVLQHLKPEYILDLPVQALYKELILYYTAHIPKEDHLPRESKAFYEQFRDFLQGNKSKNVTVEIFNECALISEDLPEQFLKEKWSEEIFRQIRELKRNFITSHIDTLKDRIQSIEKTSMDEAGKQTMLQSLSAEFGALITELNKLQ